jgi:PPOX class probable F420-dependent enzyme
MDGLDRAGSLAAKEDGLAVVITTRADGSPAATVVNAGVLDHPRTGEGVVGFVARGGTKKLTNLRARPRATVVFRSGWDWVTVEGGVELAGPTDTLDGVTSRDLPGLLRAIYAAAVGGAPDDWAGLDTPMAEEGHTAVLVEPTRIYSNPERRR